LYCKRTTFNGFLQTNLFYFPDTHIDVALFELFFDPPGNAASSGAGMLLRCEEMSLM
jgi:hypothetical protein